MNIKEEESSKDNKDAESKLSVDLPRFGSVVTPLGDEDKPLYDDDVCVPLVELPPPPDGGWGWVIVFASFMCNLILDGIAYTFGVLLNPLVEHFDSNRATVSWVGSLLAGVYLTSGPVVGGLVNKFGCRIVCIAGSVVAALGLVLSTLSPNVPVLMLTYGVIGGFGLGLVYLPAVVAVGYYFEQKRALATGISVCGSGVGTFLFAPLSTYLLEQYGWQGANLIFAGLCLNCAIFGALMRPLELTTKPFHDEDIGSRSDDGENDDDFDDDMSSAVHMTAEPRSDSIHYSHRPLLSPQPSELGPGHAMAIPSLPPLAEESVTVQNKDEHKSIADVFPSVQVPSVRTRRTRTTSENFYAGATGGMSTGRFHATPVKGPKGQMPRNSSAPHFVDTRHVMPRITSTPGFGRLTRLNSNEPNGLGSQDQVVFGLDGSQILTTNQLCLQPRRSSRKYSRPIVRPLYRKDVFYSGSIMHLMTDSETNQQQLQHQNTMPSFTTVPSQATIAGYRHSVISIPKFSTSRPGSSAALSIHRGSIVASHLSIPRDIRKASVVEGVIDEEREGMAPMINVLKEMVNYEILSQPLFLLIAISNVFGMLGFYVPFVYLPNMAVLQGIPVESANFLLSIIGISNTIGRVLVGWFSDFSWVNSLFVTNMAILLSGISVLVMPFCVSYTAFVCVALMFGLYVAAYISLTSIILVDLLGLDNLTSAFGLLVLFRGVSSMVGPPVAGSVYDATQSYDVPFYMAGGFLVLASLISFGAQFKLIIDARKKKENECDKEHQENFIK